MIEYKLNIGDVITSSGQVSYSCNGLGSCIGLFVHDRIAGQSGGAHIFLPDDQVDLLRSLPFCSVTHAVDEILRQMSAKGSSLQTLRAKLAGGANFFDSRLDVGERNSQSVIKHLVEKRIFIAASDLGGSFCRTVRFESDSGLLHVTKPQINQFRTY